MGDLKGNLLRLAKQRPGFRQALTEALRVAASAGTVRFTTRPGLLNLRFDAARYPFKVKDAEAEAKSFLVPVEALIKDIEALVKEQGAKVTTTKQSADEVSIAGSSSGVIFETLVYFTMTPQLLLEFDVLLPLFKKHHFRVA